MNITHVDVLLAIFGTIVFLPLAFLGVVGLAFGWFMTSDKQAPIWFRFAGILQIAWTLFAVGSLFVAAYGYINDLALSYQALL